MQWVLVEMPDRMKKKKQTQRQNSSKIHGWKQSLTDMCLFQSRRQHGLVLELLNGTNPNFLLCYHPAPKIMALSSSSNLYGFVTLTKAYTEISHYLLSAFLPEFHCPK